MTEARPPAAAEGATQHPYGGSGDARTQVRSLPERFRRHADALVRNGRSPLSAALMYGAAADMEDGSTPEDRGTRSEGSILSRLFAPVPNPPGSVPQLRLLGALHHLVLSGRAPELSDFYPSVSGTREPADAWPVARAAIEQHFDWIQDRLARTVQTNEPGRSTVLYSALLWLAERYRLPIRLLEIGASAGLNLLADRYCHVVDDQELGNPSSPVRFHEPWQPGPSIDSQAMARRLEIPVRMGCDSNPLDPASREDRIMLLSYIWPDERERFERNLAALELAAEAPVRVEQAEASEWLPGALAARGSGELTVIWQSVFRQYVTRERWQAIEDAVQMARQANPEAAIAWLMMEPGQDHLAHMKLSLRGHPDADEQLLARCGDHGPPVEWIT